MPRQKGDGDERKLGRRRCVAFRHNFWCFSYVRHFAGAHRRPRTIKFGAGRNSGDRGKRHRMVAEAWESAVARQATLNSSSPAETQQALYSLAQNDYNVISSGSK